MRRGLRRQGVAVGLAGLLAVLTACGGSDDSPGDAAPDPSSSEGGGGTLVFGASADPVSMDGAYVSDGESLRVVKQIFETLVTTEPGGTEIQPLLASAYEPSEDGLSWTFTLEEGVTFHDGTEFDAEAVCFNFDRWFNFSGVQQSASVSYYWQTVFGGYANNESEDLAPSLYESCEATDASTAVINLTAPSASFLSGLALASFSIASPTALEEFGADDVSGSGEAPTFNGTFGTENPIGTGPFKLDVFEPNNRLVMVRNEDYWGEKAILDRLIFQPIADGPARKQALQSGEIQGYDLVDPADVESLRSEGFQLLDRAAFNVGYVGFNTAQEPLDDPLVRQAVAHALDREALVQAQYPAGSEVANQFMPPELFGYADEVTEYPYDPERARELLAQSGNPNPTIEFAYPTGVSRPYMPNPESNFQAFAANLEAVGITVTPAPDVWNPDYLDKVNSGGASMYLLGWSGDFGDPDNFVGTFFRTMQPAWGPLEPSIYTDLEAARDESDLATRTGLYEEANQKIMDFLPGVPYVHTPSRVALEEGIEGYVTSPVSIENFSTVSLG